MKASFLAVLPTIGLCYGAATPKRQIDNTWSRVSSLLQPLLGSDSIDASGPFAPVTSKILRDYLEPVNAQLLRNSYITREGGNLILGGKRWTTSGANVYWLGLDENVQPPAGQPFYAPFNASPSASALATLSPSPDLDVFNDDAFEPIDWAVYQARTHGIRIFAPLIDNYDYYHGGKFNFLRWRGINVSSETSEMQDPLVQQFYTNRTIIDDFKRYVEHLLTHVNPYTGLSYAEDPTIFAYETGNELGGPTFGDMDVPVAWTDEICQHIKQFGPHKLCIDGTYGVNETHLSIESVDIFDDHFYPVNTIKLENDIELVRSADRVYIAGEYDWTGNIASAPSLQSWYQVIESDQNSSDPVIAGDLFWSLFTHNVPDCNAFVNHTDGFTLQYGNPGNTVQNNTQISTIRRHFFAMQNVSVSGYLPAVPCPGKYADYTYSPGVEDFDGDVY